MTSRRPGARFNRGRIATRAATPSFGALGPLSIITSRTPVVYLIGDLGVTDAGGGFCSAWADQTGNGNHATQATGASQMQIQSAALNGKTALLADGVDDFLALLNLARPAPATTPTWIWFVLQQVSWSSGDSFIGASASGWRLQSTSASPIVAQRNSATLGPNNAGATVGSWVRGQVLFTGSISDSLKLAATAVTGINTGNTALVAGTFILAAHLTSAGFANIRLLAFGAWSGGEPSAGELSAMDAWTTGYYGAGVGL